MKIPLIFVLCFTALILTSCKTKDKTKHLFILSGQSNMEALRPEASFTPIIEAEFGKENVIVVKDAKGGMPIRRWYREWKPLVGNDPKALADLYDSLMIKVARAIKGEAIATVTFVWMQGERDAREQLGDVYAKSLMGLYDQLCNDLQRKDINFIIGRLSDFDMRNKKYPHWTMIRDIQVSVAESDARFGWINTDDLNDGYSRNGKEIKDDLHMSAEGYITMGQRFAARSIELLNRTMK